MRHRQHEALHRRVVRGDQRLERVGADARPGEHLLDQHVGAEQEGEHHAERGHHRQQRVAEGVGAQHACRGQAAGARRADEVARQHAQHRGARHARERRHGEEASVSAGSTSWRSAGPEQRRGRREQAVDQVEAGDACAGASSRGVEPPERRRRPAEQEVEDVDEQQAGEEGRQRDAGGGDARGKRGRPGAGPRGGQHAERDGRPRRPGQSPAQRQLERGRQARERARPAPAGRWSATARGRRAPGRAR